MSKIRCLSARHPAEVSLDVGLICATRGDPQNGWRYHLSFTRDSGDRPVIVSERVWKGNNLLLDRPDDEDQKDPEKRSQSALEQTARNESFREVARCFLSIRYCHPLPPVIRNRNLLPLGEMEAESCGAFLMEKIQMTFHRTRLYRLRIISEALRKAVPHLHELELYTDPRGRPQLIGRYAHWRPHHAQLTTEHFSDGTLRLIAILWFLLEGGGPSLIEEPEISLHSGLIKRLVPLMIRFQKKRRGDPQQLLISTHCADLLSSKSVQPSQILLLIPGRESTEIAPASSLADAQELLSSEKVLSEEAPDRTGLEGEDQMDVPFNRRW